MVLVIGVLVFVTIIFASMVNRVRQESTLTARTSVNEQLYQLASAIGRMVVRKLQRDIETWDKESNNKIFGAVFQGKKVKDEDCTSEVENLDVLKAIVRSYSGGKSSLTFSSKYSVDLSDDGANSFAPDIPGLGSCNIEQKGFLNVETTVNYA